MPDTSEPTVANRPEALDPMYRLSEVLFGLIMVLTFTGSFSVATTAEPDVTTMLLAAFGCGVAWGLIDGVMFLLSALHERGADLKRVEDLRNAPTRDDAFGVIRDFLPPVVAGELDPATLDRIRDGILEAVPAGSRAKLQRGHLLGAIKVFLIVVASNLPVILPFLFFDDAFTALRISNGIALAMLAVIGFFYGRVSGLNAVWTALAMVLLGAVLVVMTIALGG